MNNFHLKWKRAQKRHRRTGHLNMIRQFRTWDRDEWNSHNNVATLFRITRPTIKHYIKRCMWRRFERDRYIKHQHDMVRAMYNIKVPPLLPRLTPEQRERLRKANINTIKRLQII